MDDAQWWNERAPSFAERSGPKGDGYGIEDIMEAILKSGYVNEESELLDIGSGPGNYTLRLASRFKKITAVDPSDKMLSILKERAAEQNIKNIETVCMPWEEIDIDKLGWKKKFGLVIAIKTPGIFNGETLKKMNDASMGGCFYNNFIKRDDIAQQDVWRLLYNEEKPPVPADVFYVFHILQAWGYLPSLSMDRSTSMRKMSIKEAINDLTLMMKPYQNNRTMEHVVRGYINNKSENDIFTRTRELLTGNIVWSVQ
jgi:SAM-dependent methyltransferase